MSPVVSSNNLSESQSFQKKIGPQLPNLQRRTLTAEFCNAYLCN